MFTLLCSITVLNLLNLSSVSCTVKYELYYCNIPLAIPDTVVPESRQFAQPHLSTMNTGQLMSLAHVMSTREYDTGIQQASAPLSQVLLLADVIVRQGVLGHFPWSNSLPPLKEHPSGRRMLFD